MDALHELIPDVSTYGKTILSYTTIETVYSLPKWLLYSVQQDCGSQTLRWRKWTYINKNNTKKWRNVGREEWSKIIPGPIMPERTAQHSWARSYEYAHTQMHTKTTITHFRILYFLITDTIILTIRIYFTSKYVIQYFRQFLHYCHKNRKAIQ